MPDKLPQGAFIISEIAQAHDGSLGMAHAMIDASADAGVDAVKFQTHIAEIESTLDEPWRIVFSRQDQARFDYWKRMEFTPRQWQGLAEHANRRGLMFLSSPFSVQAVELLDKIGVPFWKIASGEINNPELLESVWKTKKPILFSTGLCDFKVLDSVVSRTKELNTDFGIFQCTSEYPCAPETWGLNVLDELRDRYGCPVGLSDHSGTIFAGLAAAALGARFIEVHVTFSRQMFGPDVQASITFQELAQLVNGVRQIRQALEASVNKDNMFQLKKNMISNFGRSWALKRNLPAGTILDRGHITLKKPGSGIPYKELSKIIGKKLRVDKSSLYLLSWDDFEQS